MKFPFYCMPALLLACFSAPLLASVASQPSAEQQLLVKLDALVALPPSAGNVVRTVELLASPAQIEALCDTPQLTLNGHETRLTGKRTVTARCGARKHYLPIRINAEGTWWVTRHALASGAVVQHQDIEPMTGALASLPPGLVFDAAAIVGQRVTRNVAAGKPLMENQLRQQWRLRAGDTVDLITAGAGFRIRSQGKALNNAAVNDMLRVRVSNGQTVSGKVAADGQVMIFLQQSF